MTPTVGVVGAGAMGRVHRDAYLALGHRVILLARTARIEEVPGCTVTDSMDALLGAASVVSICTPTPSHAALARAVIERGRHVILEKPLASDERECGELIRRADGAGVRLLPAHVCRYVSANVELHRAVRAGELGTLGELRFSRSVPRPAQAWYATAASGGVVLDLMLHDLDLALWIGGPVLTAETTGPGRAELRHESGLVSTISATWGPPGGDSIASFHAAGSVGERRHSGAPATGSAYVAMLRDLVRAAATGAAARVSARDGLEAVRLARALL